MTSVLVPISPQLDYGVSWEHIHWCEEHGLSVLNLAKYYYTAGYGVEADDLGFPKYRLPDYADVALIKEWSIGSYSISHLWFNFPEGYETTAMLFKLTWGGR